MGERENQGKQWSGATRRMRGEVGGRERRGGSGERPQLVKAAAKVAESSGDGGRCHGGGFGFSLVPLLLRLHL